MTKKLVICSVLCLLAVAANATTLVYDSFDTKTVGTQLWGQMPQVGPTAWYGPAANQSPEASLVENVAAASLPNGILCIRGDSTWDPCTSTGNIKDQTNKINAGTNFKAGYDYVFTNDWQDKGFSEPRPGTNPKYSHTFYTFAFAGTTGLAAIAYNYPHAAAQLPGMYEYYKPGVGYVKSAVVYTGPWDTLELDMHIVEYSGLPGYVTGTVDYYVTPIGGVKTAIQLGVQLAAWDTTAAGANIIGFYGAGTIDVKTPTSAYLDNVRITEIPEPATMALLGLGLLSLIRRKRA